MRWQYIVLIWVLQISVAGSAIATDKLRGAFGMSTTKSRLTALYEIGPLLDQITEASKSATKTINLTENQKAKADKIQQEIQKFENALKVARDVYQSKQQAKIDAIKAQVTKTQKEIDEKEKALTYQRENLTIVDDLAKILAKEETIAGYAKQMGWGGFVAKLSKTDDQKIADLKNSVDALMTKLQKQLDKYRKGLMANKYLKQQMSGVSDSDVEVRWILTVLTDTKKNLDSALSTLSQLRQELTQQAGQGEELLAELDRKIKAASCSLIKGRSVTQTILRDCMIKELKTMSMKTVFNLPYCPKLQKRTFDKSGTPTLLNELDPNALYSDARACTDSVLQKK